MKITIEYDNKEEFELGREIADKVQAIMDTRDFVGHIIITNQVD